MPRSQYPLAPFPSRLLPSYTILPFTCRSQEQCGTFTTAENIFPSGRTIFLRKYPVLALSSAFILPVWGYVMEIPWKRLFMGGSPRLDSGYIAVPERKRMIIGRIVDLPRLAFRIFMFSAFCVR